MSHILLVEPDTLLARSYAQALIFAGHSVSCAPSAQAAIDAADEHRPDVVILELQLPTHNGVEFVYEFRSYNEWQHVPIIINTYVPSNELMAVREALKKELGAVHILYKPQASLQNMVSCVRECVEAAV